MGMNVTQMLGSDPDVLRAQLMQQEMARYNQYQDPRMNLASTLGGLLGGGVVNVAQGRNFFESNNPVLKKASQLQEIYNTTAQSIDPTANPADFYRALQGNLAAAGFGPQAAMAAQEAYKYGLQERELGLKERQVTAAEKAQAPFAQSNFVTPAGIAVFNKETGGYTVNGEPYSQAKHGALEYAAKPDWRQGLLGGGQPGGAAQPAPGGKGKDNKKLTDEEKREKFNRVQGKVQPPPASAEEAPMSAETENPEIIKRPSTSGGRASTGNQFYVPELDKSFRTEAEAKAALEAYRIRNRPQSVVQQRPTINLNPETTQSLFSLR